jgi:hypothetical protein
LAAILCTGPAPDLEHSGHAVKGSKDIAPVDFIELIGVQDIFLLKI